MTISQCAILIDNLVETLLMEIRGDTISYSAYKKKTNNQQETKLCEQIKELEYNDNTISEVLDEKNKHDLIELRKEKLNGHCIRARAKWIEEGDKTTKYFCNMESRNYYSKLISII